MTAFERTVSRVKTFVLRFDGKKGETPMDQHLMFDLSVLVLPEDGGFAAQCLEYDIAAQGTTEEMAKEAFEETFIGQIVVDLKQGKKPLEGIAKAPTMYWDMRERTENQPKRRPVYMPELSSPVFATAYYEQVPA